MTKRTVHLSVSDNVAVLAVCGAIYDGTTMNIEIPYWFNAFMESIAANRHNADGYQICQECLEHEDTPLRILAVQGVDYNDLYQTLNET